MAKQLKNKNIKTIYIIVIILIITLLLICFIYPNKDKTRNLIYNKRRNTTSSYFFGM